MKEFVKKIVKELEEAKDFYRNKWNKYLDDDEAYGNISAYDDAIKIVNRIAEEYKGGWIPCNERLPENISVVLVQVKEFESSTIGWYGNMLGWRLSEKDFDEINDFTVIAWQPLPEPYKIN